MIVFYMLTTPQYILLTKITAVQNEVALTYHGVRRLYVLAVILAAAKADHDHKEFVTHLNLKIVLVIL